MLTHSFQNEKIRVGVVRGGPSREYEISLQTGANVLKNLPEKYHPYDIFIDRTGVWYFHGAPREPKRILKNIDVVFNAMHGAYGEDGTIQKILETFGTPFTGTGSLSSALSMNKGLSKQVFIRYKIITPKHLVIDEENLGIDERERISKEIPFPCVVKPIASGSSLGVSIAKNPLTLAKAIKEAFKHSSKVIIEEMVRGKEATCGVIGSARGTHAYALEPIEIVKPSGSDFFDYDAKYSGESQELCPGNFNEKEKYWIQDAALRAHKALGLRHYSRSDFIVTPQGVYILEANTLPGLTPESLFPRALKTAGISFPEFLDHVLTLALEKK